MIVFFVEMCFMMIKSDCHYMKTDISKKVQEVPTQEKFIISDEGVSCLENAFKGVGELPAFSVLSAGGGLDDSSVEDRKGKAILQVSFLLTRGQNEILLIDRGNGRHAVTTSKSVMVSTKPMSDNPPVSDTDVLALFNHKIKSKALISNISSMRFLGVVHNRRRLKTDEDAYADYYFYVFELQYAQGSPTDPEDILKGYGAHVSINRVDPVMGWVPLNTALADVVNPGDCAADWAALHLLAMHRGVTPFAQVATRADYIRAGRCHLYSALTESYFISYDRRDARKYLIPLCKVLSKLNVLYWIQRKNAKLGYPWDLSNGNVLRHTKGMIILETHQSMQNDNVAKEVADAIHVSLQRERQFEIVRLSPEDIDATERKKFCNMVRKHLRTTIGDGVYHATDINIYRNATILVYTKVKELEDVQWE